MIDTIAHIPAKPKKSKLAQEAIADYWTCLVSRECSVQGRKDVLSGKGKFGIFGDGKELAQVSLARSVRKGDYRSGYYRDQTILFALNQVSVEGLFAELYADTKHDPLSGGRQMSGHYATPFLDKDGKGLNLMESQLNSVADISTTAGAMGRSLGLALASKIYKELDELPNAELFTKNGEEVCIATIGDASTSEGAFWETINAAVVNQVPLVVFVWDDGYGISVPKKYQTAKASISTAISGMSTGDGKPGIDIYTVKAYDYEGLRKTMKKAVDKSRKNHSPALVHVEDVTQPMGHSTSGSHQRYKDKERLQWEIDFDGNKKMAEWLVKKGFLTATEEATMRKDAKDYVSKHKKIAWQKVEQPAKEKFNLLKEQGASLAQAFPENTLLQETVARSMGLFQPEPHEVLAEARRMLYALAGQDHPSKITLQNWVNTQYAEAEEDYHTHLYSPHADSALKVEPVAAEYADDAPIKSGYEILNANFDALFQKHPNMVSFGEDVGKIGGVNQAMAGMQIKYGKTRVFDTGIREWTIMGQAIGLSIRGLRPIAEIQYLDYLIYAMSPLSDDLATIRYRSDGTQAAPAIIRTRGHRLEGIWHSGSPMGMLLGSMRGIYICVPRNMTQAAGFYNTLLEAKDPAIVIEVLNGYRLKEKMPANLGEYRVPLGIPETITDGADVTVVTYGPLVQYATKAAEILSKMGISIELIDVQTLIPFDINHTIVESLKKTNRIIFLDEDVPGGGSAFMMREVLEVQGGYQYLDSAPVCLTAKAHRCPYGSSGDYFSKPNTEDVIEAVNKMMHEANPGKYPTP